MDFANCVVVTELVGFDKEDELFVRYRCSKPIDKELIMSIVVLKLPTVKRDDCLSDPFNQIVDNFGFPVGW